MMKESVPPEELLLDLHAAVERAALWQSVRALLAHHFESSRVTLFLGHMGLGEARIVFTEPAIENTPQWYARRAALNPFSDYIARHVGATHYLFSDVLGEPAAFRQTEFYREFARVEGWDKGLSLMFWEGTDMRAMLSIYRSEEQAQFSAAEVDLALHLGRHIEIAIARVQQLDREHSLRGSLETFVRNLPAPLIVLDWSLKPVFVNAAGYEVAAIWNLGRARAQRFNARDCFRLPGSILHALQEFQARVLGLRRDELDDALSHDVTLAHPTEQGLSVRVSCARMNPSSLARPVFMLLFREPLSGSAEGVDDATREKARLRMLQELTPSERKVAELVCKGLRNDAIARKLNKSVLTVKSQMNAIFQKLGIKSRSELVVHLRP